MVGALLTGEGYEVTETPSGVEAVAKVKEGEPDVALVDLMMPGDLDGMATLARLREVAPDLPVIMMSGRAGLADAVKATKLGAFNFLEKPLTPEGVLLAVTTALGCAMMRLNRVQEGTKWIGNAGTGPWQQCLQPLTTTPPA